MEIRETLSSKDVYDIDNDLAMFESDFDPRLEAQMILSLCPLDDVAEGEPWAYVV